MINKKLFNIIKNCDIDIDKDMKSIYLNMKEDEQSLNSFYFDCIKWMWKKDFSVTVQYDGLESCFIFIESIDAEIYKEFNGFCHYEVLFEACEYIIGLDDE